MLIIQALIIDVMMSSMIVGAPMLHRIYFNATMYCFLFCVCKYSVHWALHTVTQVTRLNAACVDTKLWSGCSSANMLPFTVQPVGEV